jgi:HSP20 family protein
MLVKRNYHMPSVFDEFFNALNNFDVDRYTVPAANVKETENEFVIELAAPGMEKKDFKIDLNDNMLNISAEREVKNESKEEGKAGEKYFRQEFCYGKFNKSYNLPDNVVVDKINATYKDGILYVNIPKDKEAKLQKIIKIN